MRYILDNNGYVDSVSCTPFNCKDKGCTQYTGSVPSGYSSLQEWATTANIRAYKISSGNLVYDAARDAALQAQWDQTENMFDISGVTLNKYLSSVDGATGSSSVTHISNYIKIKANTRYIISYDYGTLANESDRSIVYYDDSKSYLKGVTYVPKSKIIQLYSEQDGYVRFAYDINITNIQVKQEATNEIYSTNELIIGTWIDGKPLYQKLINVGTLPNATKKTVNHNIANLKYIVGFEGFAYRDDGLSLPLPFVASSIANMIYLTASRTSIELTTGIDRTTFSGFVILKYIKFD